MPRKILHLRSFHFIKRNNQKHDTYLASDIFANVHLWFHGPPPLPPCPLPPPPPLFHLRGLKAILLLASTCHQRMKIYNRVVWSFLYIYFIGIYTHFFYDIHFPVTGMKIWMFIVPKYIGRHSSLNFYFFEKKNCVPLARCNYCKFQFVGHL